MSATTDEILALEKRFWTEADNPRSFDENAADELVTVLEPMGFVHKQQGLKMMADKPWNEVEMTDVQVHQPTPDCVVLAYHGQGSREGDDQPQRSSIASTYIRRDGRWQLVLTAHQPWKPKEETGS